MSIQPASLLSERLSDQEAKTLTVGPSITTVTYMRGKTAEGVMPALQARLSEVVTANPWLAGTLTKNSTGMHISFPAMPTESDVVGLCNPTRRGGKASQKALAIDSTMDFATLCGAVSGTAAEILAGSKCVNKAVPLLALTVTPCTNSPSDTFAVVFSVSHVIIDGYTYYQLLSMLSSDGTVSALSAVRVPGMEAQKEKATGAQEYKFGNSGGVLCNVICGLVCGKKPEIVTHYFDEKKVADAKAKAKEATADVDFVSTNDVLTSQFGNATGAGVMFIPVNFRERLPDFTAKDAGNYEGALFFGPDDFAEPGQIRRTLNSGPPCFQRGAGLADGVSKPLPGCCKMAKGRLGMVTNWTFPHFSELRVEGCEQMLHSPHCDVKMVPFDCAVVYRPRAGQLAAAFFVRSLSRAGIQAELPMGGMVASAEETFNQER
jgi:hypothetical protein